ncbi:MAG: hypothetical protein KJZ84_15080 [Bryobacteraceae bacterium]|nr:hypothetical protein [Bryobacteraceae bacterium]
MAALQILGFVLLFVSLSGCAAQSNTQSSGSIGVNAAQPAFPLVPVEAPKLDAPGPPPGNAILLEDRGRRGNASKRAPVTISRTFARGEMPECAEAVVAGLVVPTQCDVKTRWPDGSLRHALLSFWIELNDRAHAQVDFLPHPCDEDAAGLTKEQMLGFVDGRWDSTLVLNGSLGGGAPLEHRVRARELLARWNGEATPRGVRYWMRGPIATQVIVEDPAADFGWRHELPGVVLRGSVNTAAGVIPTKDTNANVISKWDYPLLVAMGQEVIRVCGHQGGDLQVCEGGRGVLGSTARSHSDGAPVIPDQGWSPAVEDQHKSLHPIFVLTFYPGWDGVKIETIAENVWIDRAQDQHYSARLYIGTDAQTPVWERAALIHYFSARWRKTFWYGQAPAPLRIDHNLPYLIHSRVVPNFDTSFELRQEPIVNTLKRYEASTKDEPFGSGLWQPFMPATGGRPDIAILPGYYVWYLYSWNAELQDVVEGLAAVSGHVPIHLRESPGSEREFDPYTKAPAAGRVVSIDARPSFFLLGQAPYTRPETAAADRAARVGPIGRNGWTPDDSHQPGMVYLPYALSGDWYLLEELHFWSAHNLAMGNSAACNYCRWGPLGYVFSQPRGEAWVLRTLAHAIAMTPGDLPEYPYFYSKLRNNIAIREGILNLTEGHFYEPAAGCAEDCQETRWRIGRDIYAAKRQNSLRFQTIGNAGSIDNTIDTEKASAATSPWMLNFMHSTLGVIEELGFGEVTPLRHHLAKNLIGQLVSPDFNPYLNGAYRIPTRNRDNELFQTWAEVLDAYKPEFRGRTRFTDFGLSCVDCYYDIARGTASWMVGVTSDDGLSGTEGFLWIFRNLPNREGLRSNPVWAFLPRVPPEGFTLEARRAPKWFNPKLAAAARQKSSLTPPTGSEAAGY